VRAVSIIHLLLCLSLPLSHPSVCVSYSSIYRFIRRLYTATAADAFILHANPVIQNEVLRHSKPNELCLRLFQEGITSLLLLLLLTFLLYNITPLLFTIIILTAFNQFLLFRDLRPTQKGIICFHANYI